VGNKKRKRHGRDIHGILLLDKPAGITSNEALQTVKKIFNASKAGHTGSIDRPARGLLPICFGEATKFTSYLLNADKRYQVTCRLGVQTTTGDAEGEVISTKPVPPDLDNKKLGRVLDQFRGEIRQIPPMYSAVKHQGERLYKLAYQGKEVERSPRTVTVHSIELLEYAGDQIKLEVHCTKGTYIRTLAEDIGKLLGCGAHVVELLRTAAGPFVAGDMVSLNEIKELSVNNKDALDELLLPVDAAIREMPAITLARSVYHYLGRGQAVMVPRAPTAGLLRIYNENHDFLGVAEVLEDGRIAPKKLISH